MAILPRIQKIKPLVPSFWCQTGHQQTIIGHLIPSLASPHPGDPVLFQLQDGDQLRGYQKINQNPDSKKVIAILMHGLAGSIDSDYMRRSAIICDHLKISRLLLNHRGVGDGQLMAKHPYHSGRGEDISDVIQSLRAAHPDHQILAMGFSMSGNMLLTLLSGMSGQHQPDFAITVNAPIDLKSTAKNLSLGWNRIYDLRFVKILKENLNQRKELGLINEVPQISWHDRILDFDEVFTAPTCGFRSREHYYEVASSKEWLHQIQTPTILLTSADDPFVSVDSYLSARLSDSCRLHIESRGGHMGYFSGQRLKHHGHRWLDYFLTEAISMATGCYV